MKNTNCHCEARRSCGNLNRLLSIVLVMILLFSVLPMTVFAVDTDDLADTGASYDLWLGTTQVTDANKDDILRDGTASYDSDTNTLRLNNPTINHFYNDDRVGSCAIYAGKMGGLTVTGNYYMSDVYKTAPEYGMYAYLGSTTFNGVFTFRGKKCGYDGADTTFAGGSFYGQALGTDTSAKAGIRALDLKILSGINFVRASACSYAFYSKRLLPENSIEMTDPDYNIMNGVVYYKDDDAILAATDVTFIDTQNKAYDIWLGNLQVFEYTKDDIFFDGGSAKFDPDTSTLTLNDPPINGSTYHYGYENDYDEGGYIKLYSNQDLIIKGSYHMTDDDCHIAIFVNRCDLTLDGSFTLRTFWRAIYAKHLTVNAVITEPGEGHVAVSHINNYAFETVCGLSQWNPAYTNTDNEAKYVETLGLVNSVSVSGITEPVAGAYPDGKYTLPANCGYTLENSWSGSVKWYTEDGDILDPQADKFQAGERYNAQVTVLASDGYAFADKGLTGTMNGKDVTGSIFTVNATKFYMSRWFTCSDPMIKKVSVTGITKPVIGMSPSYSAVVSGGNGYQISNTNNIFTKNGIGWFNMTDSTFLFPANNDKFAAGKEFGVFITLETTSNDYQFSDEPSATVNGKPATISAKGKNSITVFYIFNGSYILGDADDNGEIESVDATFVQRYASGISTPYITQVLMQADVDSDGNLTVMDATAIQYYIAQMKTNYAIGTVVS